MDTYLTVTEAANLLKVSKSTIWRWIDKGMLPAYRVGGKGVRIKKDELESALTPIGVGRQDSTVRDTRVGAAVAHLSPSAREQGLAALAKLQHLQQELLETHGGRKLPDSTALLQEERERRTRELLHTGDT